jgi:hypothetical protein
MREFIFYRLQHYFIKRSEQAALRQGKDCAGLRKLFVLRSGDPQRVLASFAS